MDRDFIIRLLQNREWFRKPYYIEDVKLLLKEYILEQDSNYQKTDILIQAILTNNIITEACINVALDYFSRKYSICKVINIKNGFLITLDIY